MYTWHACQDIDGGATKANGAWGQCPSGPQCSYATEHMWASLKHIIYYGKNMNLINNLLHKFT